MLATAAKKCCCLVTFVSAITGLVAAAREAMRFALFESLSGARIASCAVLMMKIGLCVIWPACIIVLSDGQHVPKVLILTLVLGA